MTNLIIEKLTGIENCFDKMETRFNKMNDDLQTVKAEIVNIKIQMVAMKAMENNFIRLSKESKLSMDTLLGVVYDYRNSVPFIELRLVEHEALLKYKIQAVPATA